MSIRAITAAIGFAIVLAVSVIMWLLIMAAIVHVVGCSVTVESGQAHLGQHHEAEEEPTPLRTPTR